MGAGMPELVVLVPMPLEPMGELLPSVVPDEPMPLLEPDDELEESVDGVVIGTGAGTMTVSSTFLLQAPSANKAASATDAVANVLIFELNMRISFKRLVFTQQTVQPETAQGNL